MFILIIVNMTSPVTNTTAIDRWQTTVLNNPAGMVNNAGNYSSNVILQAWPISYYLTPKNLIVAYNVTATPFNSTTFILNVSTSSNCSISQFAVSILSVNSTFLLYQTYSQYMDISYLETIGNFTPYIPTSTSMTDYNTQYMYRNS